MKTKSLSMIVCAFLLLSPFAASGMMSVEKDCLISSGPCTKETEHQAVRVVFDIQPKPVSPMKDLVFTVTLTEKGIPVTDAEVSVDLTMPGMFMGINRPVLTHTAEGRYKGKGVIQVCPHGGKTWKAEVTLKRADSTASASFIFEVE